MVKRMLVDANHPEETRVVVLDGTRLEEFDLETSTKKQNKGNIYLAKVIRVEPSLQAAFVDYGGNRHGFLAFSEIHPDYYQIPVADREALLAEANAHDDNLQDEDQDTPASENADKLASDTADSAPEANKPEESQDEPDSTDQSEQPPAALLASAETVKDDKPATAETTDSSTSSPDATDTRTSEQQNEKSDSEPESESEDPSGDSDAASEQDGDDASKQTSGKAIVEEIGGEDEPDENLDIQRRRFVASRRYKIQEVIKRRQILLIQVVKEERGNKGAALTTYLSLAGRYCVLMPNSSRGGGVSRKITNVKDRRRLKSILSDLNISDQMAVILRTAGAERSKAEVKRDFEYLQRTWNQIREVTMESRAPALIHEEANLIKRSIRDIYSRDIEEVYVEGEDGYKSAKDFMRTLTPSHAKKVKRYKDETIPLFHRYQVESQLDAMHSPTVQLKSGGSIVFGQTEALVAIDVNSGRATKERHIEETALKTNLEAAEEIARQLRLRDLAGLVVIDFIDMDENRNNHSVERRLKEALKIDRARIQVGRISHFGLLELSRQRLRPSLIEANFETCKSCSGTGMIRSIESTSIQTLRAIEEEGLRQRTRELTVTVNPDVALYILNYKRIGLEEIQKRYEMNVFILGDKDLIPPELRMEKVKGESTRPNVEHKAIIEEEAPQPENNFSDSAEKKDDESEGGRKRRRRRRRKRRDESDQSTSTAQTAKDGAEIENPDDEAKEAETNSIRNVEAEGEPQKRSRRRGRRGGRRRKRDDQNSPNTEQKSGPQGEPSGGKESTAAGEGSTPSNGADKQAAPSDPIPTQPSAASEPKTASRFLDVFRRGADVLRPSMTSSSAPSSDPAPPVQHEKPAEKPAEKSNDTNKPQEAKVQSQPAPSQPTNEIPSGPPRRGWWNKGDA